MSRIFNSTSAKLGALAAALLPALLCAQPAPAPKKNVPDYNCDVAKIFAQNKCSDLACHAAVGGAGGFRMSLFSGDNFSDHFTIMRQYKGRLADMKYPQKSLLLRKLSGEAAHAGGSPFKKGSEEYAVLLAWLEGGAEYRLDGKVLPVSLETPEETIILDISQTARPSFKLNFSDGTSQDITGKVSIKPSEKGVAEILPDGTVKALKPGHTLLNVSYIRNFKTISLFVPYAQKLPETKETPATPLDELVDMKLKQMNIAPSALCSDSEFLKRVYLDTTGFLPSAEAAEAFLRSPAKDKRAKLIDSILKSEEFVDYLTLKLGDLLRIKSEFPSNLWPNAVQAYSTWIRNSILQEMPYDVMVRDIITVTGTNFRQPQVNFFRAVNEKTPENYADAAALTFMGLRLNCVKCHAHPYEAWTIDNARAMFAFFGKIYFKTTKEWKEEILCVNYAAGYKDKSGNFVKPAFITGEVPEIANDEDPREAFALWLTSPSNPYFARAAVNRIWFWLMGRGIIDPADDIRPNNLPTNPELLAYLEGEFIKNSYSLKHIFKLILNSATYQRSCKANEFNAEDEKFFSHRTPSRLYAESVNDIVQTVTGQSDAFKSIIPEPYSFWPVGFRAVQITDGSVTNGLLALFGKPPRNSAYLNDRENTLTMSQVLYMSSSSDIEGKIQKSEYLGTLHRMKMPNREKVKKVYLSFLARFPTEAEMKISEDYLNANAGEGALKDIAWAIVNTKEFMFKF